MQTSQSPLLMEAQSPAVLGQLLAAMGKVQPAYYDDVRRWWVVLRHRDIHAAIHDPATYSNLIYKQGPVSNTMIAMDGKEHLRQRRMYSRAFSPHAIQRYEEAIIVPAARRIVDRIAAMPGCDLVDEFCVLLPMEVISRMLDISPEDIAPCRSWVTQLAAWNLDLDNPEVSAAGRRMYRQFADHVRPFVEEQLRRPRDNFLGEIIKAHHDGEGTIDPEQVVNMAVGLLLAGYETTTWMLACALGALLLHPEALRRVQQDRTLLMPAVEESMRWTSSAIGALRRVTRDVDLGGVTIPVDSAVLLCTAAAHYDDEVYSHPEVFDIDRKPEHLLFLPGPHYCLGAPLARMEARVGLGHLLERLPGLRLDPVEPPVFAVCVRGSPMHGPKSLRVLY